MQSSSPRRPITALLALCTLGGCKHDRRDLLDELRQRSVSEGLAITRLAHGRGVVIPFDDRAVHFELRDNSGMVLDAAAAIGADGHRVLLNHAKLNMQRHDQSASLVRSASDVSLISAEGTTILSRENRHIRGNLALSHTGHLVALSGLSYFPGDFRPVSGIQIWEIESDVRKQVAIGTAGSGLSWSPAGDELTYDLDGKIFVYDRKADHSRVVTLGAYPAWSPDGHWIAYRSPDGEAMIMSRSGEHRFLMKGRRIVQGLYWSPDGRYLAFTEKGTSRRAPIGSAGQICIYRMSDGATAGVYFFSFKGVENIDGVGWIYGYRKYAKLFDRRR